MFVNYACQISVNKIDNQINIIEFVNGQFGTVIADRIPAINPYIIYDLFITRVVPNWGYPEIIVCDWSVPMLGLRGLLNGRNIMFVRTITPNRFDFYDEGFDSESSLPDMD